MPSTQSLGVNVIHLERIAGFCRYNKLVSSLSWDKIVTSLSFFMLTHIENSQTGWVKREYSDNKQSTHTKLALYMVRAMLEPTLVTAL